jgi:hypothetical protein
VSRNLQAGRAHAPALRNLAGSPLHASGAGSYANMAAWSCREHYSYGDYCLAVVGPEMQFAAIGVDAARVGNERLTLGTYHAS